MQMTFELGGTTTVNRLGYGAMQVTGPGVWGPPRDHDDAIRVLRRTRELGVDFIDTADSYGPFISEELIAEAAGLTRQGSNIWTAVGRPEYLRQQCLLSLRRLKLERIELFQLHRIDPKVPLEDQVGELKALLEHCEANGIAFIPWFPLANGRFEVEPQVALAWLLRCSPVMLPIPGTSSVAHLEQNMTALDVELSDAEFERLAA